MQLRPARPLRRAGRGAQQGIVTLLFLLILLSAGAYFLLRALNRASPGPASAELTTQLALNTAREALLGYAVRYPDNPEIHDLGAGPGLLPCPDLQADTNPGQADPPCAKSSRTETGMFPWHTLDVPEARDGSGARLWYAVSNNYRNNPKRSVNSDVVGTLGLDRCAPGGDDIVALVIAPGAALADQKRSELPYPTADFIDDYLEGQNASAGDECFSTQSDGSHNDQVLAITRQQLMALVEKRVLDDVRNALSRYVDAHTRYPWLSPFSNPTNNAFHGQPAQRQGLLPLRQIELGTATNPSNPYTLDANSFAFEANFSLRWSIPGSGSVTNTGAAPAPDDCLRDTLVECKIPAPTDGAVLGTKGGEWTATGLCKALAGHQLSCRAVREAQDPAGTLWRRTYTVVLTNWPYTIEPPTADLTRRQKFSLNAGNLGPDMAAEIQLKDEQPGVENSASTSVLKLVTGMTVDSFELSGVPFDLEIDDDAKIDEVSHPSPGELPQWLVANDWHRLLYVAFGSGFAPASEPAGECTDANPACLTVNRSRAGTEPEPRYVGAVILSAGTALRQPVPQVRPGPTLGDYFEADNANGDDVFEQTDASTEFNDRVRILDVDDE